MSHAGRPLRIGIDARAATEVPAGQGRFARELLRALATREDGHRYRCYARTAWEELDDPRFEWRLNGLGDPWWHARVAALASRECDVFLSTNSFVTACLVRCPSVPVVYDLVTFDRSLSPNRRSMVVERLTLGLAVRRAAGIVVISQATGRALVARFPRAAPKVTVALLGVSPALAGPAASAELPPAGFVLAVGTLEPRKNLPRLAAAFAALPASLRERHPLVVAGELGWQTGPTTAALDALGTNVIRLGYVSDRVLAELYRRCGVFCYPSLGEGFGLPVLEAMAAGAAVLTSSVSSLPEVGGDAVAYCDPRSVAGITGALAALLEDPQRRAALGVLARARAAQFSWGRTAETVRSALEGAIRS